MLLTEGKLQEEWKEERARGSRGQTANGGLMFPAREFGYAAIVVIGTCRK